MQPCIGPIAGHALAIARAIIHETWRRGQNQVDALARHRRHKFCAVAVNQSIEQGSECIQFDNSFLGFGFEERKVRSRLYHEPLTSRLWKNKSLPLKEGLRVTCRTVAT